MFAQRTNWGLTPNRFSQALERARAAGRPLLDLTASNPTTVGLEYDREALLPALAQPESLQYRPQARGLASAREAVAAYYRERGASVDPAHILLTASTSEAYSFVFRLLCNPGDEVVAPAPSYPLFQFLADIQDVRLGHYPLLYDHGWQIDLHALEAKLTPRTRAIVLVHPNNPTGSYVSAAEKGRLASLCAAHDLALVVDEVFLDFAHDGRPRSSFAGDRGGLTFTLSGLSKISGLPQMKLAWMVVSGPEELAEAARERLEVIADTYLSVSTPVQLAAPAFLGQRRRFHAQLMERIRANLAELDGRLRGTALRRLEVEGGWYAVLRVPVTCSDEELAIALLEERSVVVHPGHFYDFAAEGHLVVSLITPQEEFGQGIGRIVQAAAMSA